MYEGQRFIPRKKQPEFLVEVRNGEEWVRKVTDELSLIDEGYEEVGVDPQTGYSRFEKLDDTIGARAEVQTELGSVRIPDWSSPKEWDHRTEMPVMAPELVTVYPVILRDQAGIKSEVFEKDKIEDPGRRRFLQGFGALAGVGVAGIAAGKVLETALQQPRESPEEEAMVTEGVESLVESPRFAEETLGYEAFAELRYDEVLFVDEHNRPIADALPLEDFIIDRKRDDGTIEPYNVSPGKIDEHGILLEGIAGEWLAEMRIRLKEKHPDIKIDLKKGVPRVFSINGKFKSVVYDSGDADLAAEITSGKIVNYLQIVEHFANRPFSFAEPYPVRQYIDENIEFKNSVPELVQNELRRILPGLCAQESNFNNRSVSKSGARGIFQFMPATWGEYDVSPGGIVEGVQSLEKQVSCAGAFFSDLYKQIPHHAGAETMQKLRTMFDEETLQKDILVPLMVNAYNAGGALMGEALRLFLERSPQPNFSGKDFFLALADFAEASDGGEYLSRYGNEAREYVPRIYANANVIHQV